MKKTIIKWSIIAAVILGAILSIQFIRARWIAPCLIEKIEFKGYCVCCEGIASATVELSRDEIRELMRIYNTPVKQRELLGEGCNSDYSFKVYLVGGVSFYVREAGSPRIEVNPIFGKKYWIFSDALTEYAEELIEKYNLLVSPT